ncbi:hypothetical protein [Spongiibacter sp.]
MTNTMSINDINKAETLTDIAARIVLASIVSAGFLASIIAL